MPPLLTERFDRALTLASDLHRGDLRKGSGIPYVAHVLAVCGLVLEAGGDEDEAIAALLHDALEDHPERITREGIRDEFGERVLELVEGCTDTPPDYAGGRKPPWRARKEAYVEHVREAADAGGVRISLADKLHNARSILADYRRIGDEVWTRFRVGHTEPVAIRTEVLWYYRAMIAAFRHAGAGGYLLQELERTVAEIERLVEEDTPAG